MTILEKGSLKIDRKVRKMLKSDQEKEDLAIWQAKLAGNNTNNNDSNVNNMKIK
jgi:hypothetical protein